MSAASIKNKFVNHRGLRNIKKSAEGIHASFTELESSANAEALNKKNFQVDPIYRKENLSTERQLAEIEGRVPFDKGNYHHPEYERLIKTVVPLR